VEPSIGALIVSLATLVMSGFAMWHKADTDYVKRLEVRVVTLEEQLLACTNERDQLMRENIELMRKIARAR
jgi:hypothetical protein